VPKDVYCFSSHFWMFECQWHEIEIVLIWFHLNQIGFVTNS